MQQLKLGPLLEERPVKLTIEISAALHRDLTLYGNALGNVMASKPIEPARLIAPMLSKFIASDREFSRLRRSGTNPS